MKLLALLLAIPLYGAVDVVQQGPAQHSTSTGNTVSSTFATTPVLGDVIAVAVGTGCGSTACGAPTCSDNQGGGGNTYTLQITGGTGFNPDIYWFTAPVTVSAGTFTITCVQTISANAIQMIPFELHHASSATPTTTNQATLSLGNNSQTGTCSLTTTGDVILLVVALQDDDTVGGTVTAAASTTLMLTDIWASAANFSTGTSMTGYGQSGGVNGTYTPGFTMTFPGAGGPFHLKIACMAIPSAASLGKGSYVYSR